MSYLKDGRFSCGQRERRLCVDQSTTFGDRMANLTTRSTRSASAERDEWFEEIIAQLRIDQLQLETNTASREKRERYETLMSGDPERLLLQQQAGVTRHFVGLLVRDFVRRAIPHLPRIKLLAATANDAEVLMWIELKAEDELLEDQLTLIEAEVNAAFHDRGYDLDLMIVEAEDELSKPAHYVEIYSADEPLPSAPAPGEQ